MRARARARARVRVRVRVGVRLEDVALGRRQVGEQLLLHALELDLELVLGREQRGLLPLELRLLVL
eukprot:scaffold32227_cov35-Phaeocystis_antarctica.AAC.1